MQYRTYGIYSFCVFAGFILRWVKDKRRGKKVYVPYYLITSGVVSYVAYLVYRDKGVSLCSVEIWLIGWSYFSSKAVSLGDDIFEYGFKSYFRMLGNRYNDYSQKDNKTLKDDDQ